MSDSFCTLCSLSLPSKPIVEDDSKFCCLGCQIVYQVLSAQNALSSYRDSSLFQGALKSGIISNQKLAEKVEVSPSQVEVKRIYFEIRNLWCASCCKLIELVCLKMKGVISCHVDYSTDLALMEFDPRYVLQEKIFSRVASLGYEPLHLDQDESKQESSSLNLRLGVASFSSLNIMMLSYPIYANFFGLEANDYTLFFGWVSLFLSLPLLFFAATPIFKKVWMGLKVRLITMDALIALGISSSFVLSLYQLLQERDLVYFDSMSMIIVFVLWGKIMEKKAKFSAKSALFALQRSFPKRGRKREKDQRVHFVPIKEIALSDTLLVCNGEKVVLDGLVIEGEGAVDESFLTGEAKLSMKSLGSKVLAGSLLKSGWLAIKVSASLSDTFYQKIIDIVQGDLGKKEQEFSLVDRIVSLFVPGVLLLALFCTAYLLLTGYSFEKSVVRAIALLLISCPCAIGIAIPLTQSLLIQRLINMGVILRNRSSLSLLGKEDTIVFDKTGTLTEGKFHVLEGLQTLSEEHLSILKNLTSFSTHPLSCALASSIGQVDYKKIIDFKEFLGRGIKGVYSQRTYLLGSLKFLEENGIVPLPLGDAQEDTLVSTIYFAEDEKCVARITLGDKIRSDVIPTLKALKAKKILLSGDSESVAQKVAKECAIDMWYGERDPMQKRALIESLKKEGKIVCMVGDGINDAPALTAADIGISTATATDISVHVSDIFIATSALSVLPKIFELAKRARKIALQNLFWAFFYNIIGLFLALFGIFPPIIAALAMVLSSLIVIFNAKRL